MKYQIIFYVGEGDKVNAQYVNDAIEWTLDNDIDQYSFIENLEENNDDYSDFEYAEFLEENYKKLKGKEILKHSKIIEDAKYDEDYEDIFAIGDPYRVVIDINMNEIISYLQK